MHILFLTGNNQKNVEWATLLKQKFQDHGIEGSLVYSDIWKIDKNGDLDMEREFQDAQKILKNIKEYVICSVATGGLISLKGMYEKQFLPSRCIFIGIPIVWGYDRFSHENAWLNNFNIPSLFIQKISDPITSAAMLERVLKKHKIQNSRVHELVGHTHTYNETDEIFEECMEFLEDGK